MHARTGGRTCRKRNVSVSPYDGGGDIMIFYVYSENLPQETFVSEAIWAF